LLISVRFARADNRLLLQAFSLHLIPEICTYG